jgi:hypothetical protein
VVIGSRANAEKGGDMSVKPCEQLSTCDLCQRRIADRCFIRLRLQMCVVCAVFIEAATGEHLGVGVRELNAVSVRATPS